MREDAPENYTYAEFDPRVWGQKSRDRVVNPNGKNVFRTTLADRVGLSGTRRVRQHYGDADEEKTGFSRFHDFILEKFGLIVGIGVTALIVWLLAKVFKIAVPAKWTFLYGLLNVLDTVGWWVMIICAIVLILGWILGHVHKLMDWAKSRY